MAMAAGGLGLVVAQAQAPGKRRAGDREITVALTGQSLIQTDIRRAGEAFAATAPLLQGDVIFTNFETTVREPGGSLARLDPGAGVHAPPEALDGLREQGFNLLSMANNHIYDLGESGMLAARREARRRELAFSGIGDNLQESSAPGYLRTAHGLVALVSMATGFLQEEARAADSHPGLNELALADGDASPGAGPATADAKRILGSIGQARKLADLVIVCHHNHVYDRPFVELMRERSPDRLRPPAWIKAWAHREVDAGADIVVMHGAPFLQGVEIYDGKPIFYDLGNYIFQVPPQHVDLFGPLAGESAIARVMFADRKLRTVTLHPIALDPRPTGEGLAAEAARGLPAPAFGSQAEAILRRFAELSAELGARVRVADGAAELVLPEPQ
jgi:poly-gamma-glutamate synthesis protein (capsule biosynthesis protein)